MPMTSHYYVALGLARQLRDKGYEVYFTYDGQNEHRELIRREGFKSIYMMYATEYKHLSPKLMLALFLKTILDPDFTRKRYRSFLAEMNEILRIEKEIHPSLIFIDSHFSHNILFLWKSIRRIIILNTKLSTRKAPCIPPLNVGWVAQNTCWSYLKSEWAWVKYLFPKRLKLLKEWIIFLGYSDEYFYQKIIRHSHQRNVSQWLTWQNSFDRGAIGIPKLITYPRCLEYTWKPDFVDEYYVEIPFQKIESGLFTEQYCSLIEQLKTRKQEVKVIYCALGTLGGNFLKRAGLLLHKIIEAFGNEPNVELVIVSGNISLPPSQYDNVHIFDKVPQLDILKHANVMINHGGLNSISECIHAGVPMLIYPLIENCDHGGNAARVVANGFGLKGNVLKETSEDIKKKSYKF